MTPPNLVSPLVILAGCGVAVLAVGCGSEAPADTGETWHGDVAPLVAEKCVGCHNDSGIAPFSMESYETAGPRAADMAAEVESGRMPPWLAHETDECVPRYGWRNDIRLTAAEKEVISRWAEAGAPEGSARNAAALPQPVSLTLEDPDISLTIPVATEVDGDADQFWCYVIETGLEQDTWIEALQVNAGNPRVVHHVLVYDDAQLLLGEERAKQQKYECFGGPGVSGASLVTAWAPGGVPNQAPEGGAFELKANARLIMQVHYHPTGEPETDDGTSLDMRIADGTPAFRLSTALIGNFVAPVVPGGLLPGSNDPAGVIEFKIPAGASNHVETMFTTLSSDMIIYGSATHMHYVGTSMVVHLEHTSPGPDEPARECLVHTPRWDFNWQRGYQYDAPLSEVPVGRPGDKLHFQCRYDNSLGNPFVREALRDQGLDAPQDVFMGEATLDEMCLGSFGVATPIE